MKILSIKYILNWYVIIFKIYKYKYIIMIQIQIFYIWSNKILKYNNKKELKKNLISKNYNLRILVWLKSLLQ